MSITTTLSNLMVTDLSTTTEHPLSTAVIQGRARRFTMPSNGHILRFLRWASLTGSLQPTTTSHLMFKHWLNDVQHPWASRTRTLTHPRLIRPWWPTNSPNTLHMSLISTMAMFSNGEVNCGRFPQKMPADHLGENVHFFHQASVFICHHIYFNWRSNSTGPTISVDRHIRGTRTPQIHGVGCLQNPFAAGINRR